MAIDIVDFPINSMVIFHSYVSSPEGNKIHDKIHKIHKKSQVFLVKSHEQPPFNQQNPW